MGKNTSFLAIQCSLTYLARDSIKALGIHIFFLCLGLYSEVLWMVMSHEYGELEFTCCTCAASQAQAKQIIINLSTQTADRLFPLSLVAWVNSVYFPQCLVTASVGLLIPLLTGGC